MTQQSDEADIIKALKERAKELNCIYRVEELLQDYEADPKKVFQGIISVIPAGYSYPDICEARFIYKGVSYQRPGFVENDWVLSAKVYAKREIVGTLEVCYTEPRPQEDEGPFLKEERKLIEALADSIGHFIMHQELAGMVRDIQSAQTHSVNRDGQSAKVIADLLFRTDQGLFIRVARRMLNYLYRHGNAEAEQLFKQFSLERPPHRPLDALDANAPMRRKRQIDPVELSQRTFEIALKALSDREIITRVQRWMQEDKVSFLIRVLNDPSATTGELADKVRRFQQIVRRENLVLPDSLHRAICVHLIRRLMSASIAFIQVAKLCVSLEDFYELFSRLIYPANSYGKLGGKGSGLFIASQVIKKEIKDHELFKNVRVPKTYYLSTDGLYNFIEHNCLEEVFEQKYKDIELIRQEYPQIIALLKNGEFPQEIVQQISVALDDLGDSPLIVRSSSVLEDQLGSAFSGKYKSLFLGNQGTKQERLEALMDAIAEVFASTFSPDPMKYRAERGLLDAQEDMGVLIEEVVGIRVGPYYFPLFAGVAFSRNDFRWSPRIKREDGLVRLVPGLGTRAVDRLSDDYPILIAPGQPNLRANVTEDEIIRYSPNKMDVINLEKNVFESIEVKTFIRDYGDQLEGLHHILSIQREGHLQEPSLWNADFRDGEPVVTFNGLIKTTPFIKQIHEILKLLQARFGYPVDIEFASDGKFFYLLQCRPQSYSGTTQPAVIPRDLPSSDIVFSAKKYVSNGLVADISHIVYVDPAHYSKIQNRDLLMDVGRAVSKLNASLPRRQFILMGPGRWGSRGDIKLGVNVTYSDISNTAMLIEIARKKGQYVPDLSFGTHFFQDLVEADIRYLPLYPDDEGIIFNEKFLGASRNILPDILPEYRHLNEVLRVLDVSVCTGGLALHVHMNGDLDEALGILAPPTGICPRLAEDRAKGMFLS